MGKHKHIIFLSLALLGFNVNAFGQSFTDQTDAFLKKYVTQSGVDYTGIKANNSILIKLVERIGASNLDMMTPSDKKAFLINAYNLLVIHAIVRVYPIKSPQDHRGFFNHDKFLVGGISMTLDHLEKKLLFGLFDDARMHFALVCAAKGCPPLMPSAFRGSTIEDSLEERTRNILTDFQFVRSDSGTNKVHVTKLFDWYRVDFEKEKSDVLSFINAYRSIPFSAGSKVIFMEYDWSLNEKKKTRK
jgi:hypothetical protein